ADSGFAGSVEDLGERSSYESPGWKRMQKYAARETGPGPIIDGKADLIATSSGDSGFKIGQRVFHDKFGYGKVVSAEGTKLTVDFEKTNRKKVISTFLTGA
ncbi:MAG: DNA helicase II, partial [Pseudomonadota bacterium]